MFPRNPLLLDDPDSQPWNALGPPPIQPTLAPDPAPPVAPAPAPGWWQGIAGAFAPAGSAQAQTPSGGAQGRRGSSREMPHFSVTDLAAEVARGRATVGDYVQTADGGLMRIMGLGADGQPTLAPDTPGVGIGTGVSGRMGTEMAPPWPSVPATYPPQMQGSPPAPAPNPWQPGGVRRPTPTVPPFGEATVTPFTPEPPAAPPPPASQPGLAVMPERTPMAPDQAAPAGLTVGAPRARQQGVGLAGALAGLSEEQRVAAMLHVIKGDYGEVAKMLTDTPASRVERTAAEERGKALGTAQVNLPTAVQTAQSMTANIDAVLADPNLGWVTGRQSDWNDTSTWSAFANPFNHLGNIPSHIASIPNIGSSSQLRTTRSRIGQIQGQAFMQAFQALRGAGAISDQEGKAAMEAIGRLSDLAQDDDGYVTALHDVRREIHSLTNLARTRAGQQPVPYQPHSSEPRPPVQPADEAAYNALPSGTRYVAPDGTTRTKR